MTGPDSEGLQAAHERDVEPAIVRAVHRVIDCRSSVGETMGMIDAAIHCLRVASRGDVSDPVVVEALRDLVADPEVRTLLASLPSPVVPSVGGVPVEVPEVEFDFTLTGTIAEAVLNGPGEWIGIGAELALLASVVREKVKPLIAARVRAEGEQQFAEAERILEQAIRERDEAEEWADKLAAALAGDAAGEHSSANNPWQNALDIAADHDARVRAEERQRCIAAIDAVREEYEALTVDAMWSGGMRRAVTIIAAGSAVPVATPPEHDAGCERTYGPEDCTCQRRADVDFSHTATGPVATPTDPVDEVKCPDCEATIRARMSDQPEVAPAEPTIAEQAGYYVVTFPGGDTSTWETNRSYLFNPTAVWQLRNNADALEAITRHRSRTAPAEQDGQR